MVKLSNKNVEIDAIILDDQPSQPSNPKPGYHTLYVESDGLYTLVSGNSPTGPLGGRFILQKADSAGLDITGYDDSSDYYLRAHIDDSGDAIVTASGNILVESEGGNVEINSTVGFIDLIPGSGSSLTFGDGINPIGIYSNIGPLEQFVIRDLDSNDLFSVKGDETILLGGHVDGQGIYSISDIGNIDIDQASDESGIQLYGFSDQAAEYLKFGVGAVGYSQMETSGGYTVSAAGDIFLNATDGFLEVNVTENILFDLGDDEGTNKVYIRDSAEQVVASIDSDGGGVFTDLSMTTQAILDNSILTVDGTIVDTDMLVANAAGVEGLTYAELIVLWRSAGVIGIGDNDILEVDGTVANNDIMQATTVGLKGLTYAELVGLIDGAAAWDFGDNDLHNMKQVDFQDFHDNDTSGTSKTIDWNNGNKQKLQITGNACDLSYTDPAGACALELRLIGDGTLRTNIDADHDGDCTWADDGEPDAYGSTDDRIIGILFYSFDPNATTAADKYIVSGISVGAA